MADIHIVLQGKGGVGKSYIASIIAQYCIENKGKTDCYDTDPTNHTFTGYKALKVEHVDIMEGDDVNQRRFDDMLEKIATTKAKNIVIDNGASTFIPLASYIKSNDVFKILSNLNHTVYIHTVVTGGQARNDTLTGFDAIAESFGHQTKLVVWQNEYFGAVEKDGMPFTDMKVYAKNEAAVDSIVIIPELKRETFGQDVKDMLQDKETFDERLKNPEVKFMEKQRLTEIKRQLFENMSVVYVEAREEELVEA